MGLQMQNGLIFNEQRRSILVELADKFSQDGVLDESRATVKSVIWSGVRIPRLSSWSCSNEFCLVSIK